MSELPSQALARLGERIFGTDWAAPMSRMTGIHARTLLRIKSAAAEGRDYRGAIQVLAALENGLRGAAVDTRDALAFQRTST